MKKLLLILTLFCSGYIGFSQEVGVRFGEVLGNNVALDVVFHSSDFTRIHADLSFGSSVGLEVLWDLVYRPLGGEAFYWYLGVGPSMLFSDPFLFGLSGEVGLEYRFNTIPLAVGADWRPTLYLVEETEFESGGFGFNVRFVFD